MAGRALRDVTEEAMDHDNTRRNVTIGHISNEGRALMGEIYQRLGAKPQEPTDLQVRKVSNIVIIVKELNFIIIRFIRREISKFYS